MDQQTIDWSNLTPEQRQVLDQIVLSKQVTPTEEDDYAAKIRNEAVARAVEEVTKRFGPYIGDSVKHTAMTKLTEGLSEKAKASIVESFKDKPADELAYLANSDGYRDMLRDAAEYRANKVAPTEPVASTGEKGEGTQPDVTQAVKDFQAEMKKLMPGTNFSDAEAEKAVAKMKTIPDTEVFI